MRGGVVEVIGPVTRGRYGERPIRAGRVGLRGESRVVARVCVRGRQGGDRRALGSVLVDRASGQRDVGRRFVDKIVDRDGDDLGVRVAAGIRGLDRDVVGCRGLEVDIGTGRDTRSPSLKSR